MVSERRWLKAQKFERSWWAECAARIEAGIGEEIDYHGWKAREMEKRLSGFLPIDARQSARVLEIGCGPVGIVSAMKWGERHAVDPLEDFYRTLPTLLKCRDPLVKYETTTGEALAFEKQTFTLVILDNVLDHVRDAGKVLQEVYRVLTNDGILYFAVNIRTAPGTLLHRVLARLQIDKGHPYSFKAKSIREFLERHQFVVLREDISDPKEARSRDRNALSMRAKIKGYTGLYEFVYYAVCRKAS